MAKVVLTMQYEVEEDKRTEYLSTVEELRKHFGGKPYITYGVYEQKGKRNAFAEMFVSDSEEQYRQYEEAEDDVADQLAAKLATCIKDGKARYTTYVELR